MADFFFENNWPCCIVILQDSLAKPNQDALPLHQVMEGKFQEILSLVSAKSELKHLRQKLQIQSDLTRLMLTKPFEAAKKRAGPSKEEKKLKNALL